MSEITPINFELPKFQLPSAEIPIVESPIESPNDGLNPDDETTVDTEDKSSCVQKELSKILEEVLKSRTPFDFVKRHNSEIYNSLENDKFPENLKNVLRGQITQPDDESIAMYTAENMLSDFKSLHYDICTIDNDVYIYDGLDWRPLLHIEAQHFLSSYLKKSGLPKSKAESATAIERFTKQLYFSLYRHVGSKKNEKALINAQNCTVEIDRNGNISQREHNENDYFYYVLPYEYDPTATAKLFTKFLDDILPKDIQLVVQEFYGTCFMRYLKHEKVLCNIGAGANGKSVMATTSRYVLGVENVTSYSINSLCDEKSTTRYNINHKLLNFSTDFSGKIWNNGIFKQLASGEPVEARRLYHDSTIITDYARLAFNSNTMPDSNDTSAGFLRRLLIVEFNKTIPVDKRDPNLADKLCKEAPGILNWMIEGLVRFIKNGYKFSASTTLNTSMQAFQDSSNNVKAFMDSMSYKPGNTMVVKLKDLYTQYRNYCGVNNIKAIESQANFKIKLDGLAYKIESANKKATMIHIEAPTVAKPI